MGINSTNIMRIVVVLLLIHDTFSIRDVYIRVPDAAQYGSKVEMRCIYRLEDHETLYTVKWYRGDREFCRYTPRDVPPLKVFDNIPGITVNKDESDAERITIEPVTQVANGRFTCEVSADAPSFQTHQLHAYMNVVDLPTEGPEMHGMKVRYKVGMKLKVECISRNSLPAANLSFFINNEPALSQHVWHRVEATGMSELGELWTSYSTIQFTVQKQHIRRERLKLRCTALIYSLYTKSLEKCALEERVHSEPRSTARAPPERIVPIHRLPAADTNASNINLGAISTLRPFNLICLATVLLPTVLRKIT